MSTGGTKRWQDDIPPKGEKVTANVDDLKFETVADGEHSLRSIVTTLLMQNGDDVMKATSIGPFDCSGAMQVDEGDAWSMTLSSNPMVRLAG